MADPSLFILLADDDKDDCILFKEALREIHPDIRLIAIENGNTLMDFLNTTNFVPGIIFLDINMPYKNGLDCLDEIRGNETFTNIPIVIYSTSSNPKDIRETYKAGANLYIIKPSSFSHLIDMISQLLEFDWSDHQPYPPVEQFVWNGQE